MRYCFAIPSASKSVLRKLLEEMEDYSVKVRILTLEGLGSISSREKF